MQDQNLKITIALSNSDDEALVRYLGAGGRQGARRMRHLARIGLAATRLGVVIAEDERQRLILFVRNKSNLVELESLIDPSFLLLSDSGCMDKRHSGQMAHEESDDEDHPLDDAESSRDGWLDLDTL